jgi:Flp pilus assembly CpaF family ATPase
MAKAPKPIRVKFGKGVLAKDNRTPYAAGTIHATSIDGFMSPYPFSYATVARLLADDGIIEIQVIDKDNVQSTITKTWLKKDTSRMEAMRAEMVAMTSRIVAETQTRRPPARRRKPAASAGARP